MTNADVLNALKSLEKQAETRLQEIREAYESGDFHAVGLYVSSVLSNYQETLPRTADDEIVEQSDEQHSRNVDESIENRYRRYAAMS